MMIFNFIKITVDFFNDNIKKMYHINIFDKNYEMKTIFTNKTIFPKFLGSLRYGDFRTSGLRDSKVQKRIGSADEENIILKFLINFERKRSIFIVKRLLEPIYGDQHLKSIIDECRRNSVNLDEGYQPIDFSGVFNRENNILYINSFKDNKLFRGYIIKTRRSLKNKVLEIEPKTKFVDIYISFVI